MMMVRFCLFKSNSKANQIGIFNVLATYKKISDKAYEMEITEKPSDARTGAAGDSDEEDNIVEFEELHMQEIKYKYEESICASSSDGSESHRLTPVPDDANSKCNETCVF